MRSHLVLIWSFATIFGANPIDAPAQASCSQREWRLLSDYDARLMRAYDSLDWTRYAGLQRQLLGQLSRECLAALDQQHALEETEPARAGPARRSAHAHGGAYYGVHRDASCEGHGCAVR